MQDAEGEELVLVVDLGGGTYDVSMLLVGEGLTEIVCTAGDAQLGGSNFDVRVAQYILRMTQLSNNISAETFSSMVRAGEKVRRTLVNQQH